MKTTATFHPTLKLQMNSTPETNGDHGFTQSETNHNAVHAGPSDQLKHSQTDSLLPQREASMKFSPHKTWYLVTRATMDVQVDTSTRPGNILPALVLLLTSATHTSQPQELPHHALLSAMMVQLKLATDTSASQTLLLTQPPFQPLRPNSTPTDQLKEVSQYTKTSTATRVVFITTPQDPSSVVTPSRFLDMELPTVWTTGSVLTHGEAHGEKRDTSESSKETAVLTTKSMPAHQTPPHNTSELYELSESNLKSILIS